MSYGHLDLLSIYIHLVNKETLAQFYLPSPFTPSQFSLTVENLKI